MFRHVSPRLGYGDGSVRVHPAGNTLSVRHTPPHAGDRSLSRASHASHCTLSTWQLMHCKLRAQQRPVTRSGLSTRQSHIMYSVHGKHMLRAHSHVSTKDPCRLFPTPTPYLTPLSQAQAVQTSYLLLIITSGPLCPGKGVGHGAQHAPLLLWGLIPPPARLDPGASVPGPWGQR